MGQNTQAVGCKDPIEQRKFRRVCHARYISTISALEKRSKKTDKKAGVKLHGGLLGELLNINPRTIRRHLGKKGATGPAAQTA